MVIKGLKRLARQSEVGFSGSFFYVNNIRYKCNRNSSRGAFLMEIRKKTLQKAPQHWQSDQMW